MISGISLISRCLELFTHEKKMKIALQGFFGKGHIKRQMQASFWATVNAWQTSATVGSTLHVTKPDKATEPQLTPAGWRTSGEGPTDGTPLGCLVLGPQALGWPHPLQATVGSWFAPPKEDHIRKDSICEPPVALRGHLGMVTQQRQSDGCSGNSRL